MIIFLMFIITCIFTCNLSIQGEDFRKFDLANFVWTDLIGEFKFLYPNWSLKLHHKNSVKKLDVYLETFHLASTQFCGVPHLYRKTGFL